MTTTRTRRIWQDGNTVYLRDEDPIGDEIIREFWVPPGGGYVREIEDGRPGTLGTQVCNQLRPRGPTLHSSEEGLLDLIRREYRSRVASDKRQEQDFR